MSLTHSPLGLPSVFGAPDAMQAGLGGDPIAQLLIALVAIALVIVIGKFVLSLAWRLVTIGVVVVAIIYGLSAVGVF
ncbi:hypothetical protein [Halorubrum vacuolatum]|nr:hypothetical protein [Halorubrum vacuolatum]